MIDPDVPAFLRGDPGRLRQVLVNLAGNAVKFTEQGEVVIRAVAGARGRARGDGALRGERHRDRHPEAPARPALQAVHPGRRFDHAQVGGTGLGLAISKQLVELMGGQIGVGEREGQGSTFWFTAVLDKQPDEAPRPAFQRGRCQGQQGARRGRLRSQPRSSCRCSWRAGAARSAEACDGRERAAALADAAESGDAVRRGVLDMQMPDVNGLTLGRQIKPDPRLARTAV